MGKRFADPPHHTHPHHGVGTEEDPPAGPSHLPLPAGVADHPRTLEMGEGRATREVQGWPCRRVAEYFPG